MIFNTFETFVPFLSVTCTVKLNVPACVGVPLQAPPAEKLSPPGFDPAVRAHVYGDIPPVATTLAEYLAPTFPDGSDVVTMASGPVIVILSVRDPLDPAVSVAFTVTS